TGTSIDQVFPALSSSPPADNSDGSAVQGLVPVTSMSSNYSDALDNDSDIEEDDDDEEDEGEFDQDMLAIMHDMDEVQRLQ
ncbi:hypothetical protein GGF42_003933, partial [Coemansia sp. RSA 2424]